MKWLMILLCLLLPCAGCSKSKDAPPAKNRVVLVATAPVVAKDMPLSVDAPGTVEPLRTVTILSQVTAPLEKIMFREGRDVAKDEILFVLDKAPFIQEVKEAECNLEKEKALLAYQKPEARRTARISKGGGASQSKVERTRADALGTEAMIRADTAALELARLNLSYCTIRAPFSGRTGRYLAHEGTLVEVAETPLVVINQISPIHVGFSVPEKRLPAIQAFMREHSLTVTAASTADRNLLCEGRLVFLDNDIDRATGMLFLKGEFENKDGTLWPGQYVQASLILQVEKDALTVPQSAVVLGQKGSYVFVVKEDMTVASRQVAVNRIVRDEAVIADGLEAGETVVVSGQNKLQNGFRVKVAKATPKEKAEGE
ncbi:MAG: efflux RND transporter periplasmic adaptor subunit [Deltaproteobacteria bacterium]|nr:efflux RND transporter periplasmic adaptor subunit [Deltaproteobacteria bacterium]